MTSKKQQVRFVKSTDALSLDLSATLSDTRQALDKLAPGFLSNSDRFLFHDAEVPVEEEGGVHLGEVVHDENTVAVGTGRPADGFKTYHSLDTRQRRALLRKLGLHRGLTLSATRGLSKTAHNLVSLKENLSPKAVAASGDAEINFALSFSPATNGMAIHNVDQSAALLQSVLNQKKSAFDYAQSLSSNNSVTAYHSAVYVARQVSLTIDTDGLTASKEFVKAVKAAIKGEEESLAGYMNLLETLNAWGYFVPTQFSLGDSLYASATSDASNLESAERENARFITAVKDKFDEISGDAASDEAVGTGKSSHDSHGKHHGVMIRRIGGLAGTQASFGKWIASLDSAIHWDVVSIEALYPSIILISTVDMETFNYATQLMDRYHSEPDAIRKQPFVDMNAYSTNALAAAQSASGGSPWG